jgi:two-component system response regulator AtoC
MDRALEPDRGASHRSVGRAKTLRDRVKTRTTVVGDGPEWQEGVPGIRLLVIGRDSYETFDLPASGTVTIGRAESCDIRLNDPQASRAHANLQVGDELTLEDLGSVNGTRVRDRPVGRGERVPIHSGDTIVIGSSVLIVHARARNLPTAAFAESPTYSDNPLGDLPMGKPGGAMQEVYRLAERAAAGNINVLVLGETGVGKEVMATTLHQLSPRRAGPYVCVNCATMSSEGLLESELFGHERGAFTGAISAKPGLLETAAGGTLFLDEVGDLPLATQAKLLRTLETKEVMRLGSVRSKRIDVRFIAATNRNLRDCIARGTFREDLFFRLDGMTLVIPPLRDRREEILPLAERFVREFCQDLQRPEPKLSPMVIAWLERQPWDGNIRQLKHAIERAVLLCVGPEIRLEHMPSTQPPQAAAPRPTLTGADLTNRALALPLSVAPVRNGNGGAHDRDRGGDRSGGRVVEDRGSIFAGGAPADRQDVDRQSILDALAACAGNQSRAARMLGMPRRTFVARLDRYDDIPRPKKVREQGRETGHVRAEDKAPAPDKDGGGPPDDDPDDQLQ